VTQVSFLCCSTSVDVDGGPPPCHCRRRPRPDARSSCSFQHVHGSPDLLLGSRKRVANVLFRSGPEFDKGVGYGIPRSIQILSHHSEPRTRYSRAAASLNVGTRLPRAGALWRHYFGTPICHVHLPFKQFSLSRRAIVGCRKVMEAVRFPHCNVLVARQSPTPAVAPRLALRPHQKTVSACSIH